MDQSDFELTIKTKEGRRVARGTSLLTLQAPPELGTLPSVRRRTKSHYGVPRADVEAAAQQMMSFSL
jgi:hypothetical protein